MLFPSFEEPMLAEIPRFQQRPRPLDGNLNWDQAYFELESLTNNVLSFLNELFRITIVFYQWPKKPESDFEWFTSEDIDLKDYRGKYIAVFDRQIIGSGKTAKEAYNMAKALYPQCEPALTYIPENEDTIL